MSNLYTRGGDLAARVNIWYSPRQISLAGLKIQNRVKTNLHDQQVLR